MNSLSHRIKQLESTFPLRTVSTDGGCISYRENMASNMGVRRNSITVVALHGIGSASASWLDVALCLSDIRFIAWDAPGYGKSTGLQAKQPLATDYAIALDGFLNAMQIQQCILVGHSLGALMSAAYVAKPNISKVEQAIFISPARGYGSNIETAKRIRDERLQTLQILGIIEMAKQRSERLLSSNASDEAREWVQWNMANLNPTGYKQAVELLCGDDISRYSRTAIPVAVYCGSNDIVTVPTTCLEIANSFQATYSLIDGAGHASHCEKASDISRIIENFQPSANRLEAA